jgi:tetratricopeptide (TPR) repeat protein
MRDLLGMESDVAVRVASALHVTLSDGEERRFSASPRTANADAWFDYMRGRQLTTANAQDLQAAIGHLEHATEIDSQFALAYAGLADALTSAGMFGLQDPRQARRGANAAAERAVGLDRQLGEAYAAVGWIRFWFDWDWVAAEEAFVRALELNPSSAAAQENYAHYLVAMRRFPEALEYMKEWVKLDPLNPHAHSTLAWAYYHAGRYDESIEQLRVTAVRFPDYNLTPVLLAWAYAGKGMNVEAVASARKGELHLGDDPWLKASLAFVYGISGQRTETERILEELHAQSGRTYVDPRNFAVIYGVLGDTARALSLLEDSYRLGSPEMVFLNMSDIFHRPIRETARYKSLVSRMRFPQ